MSGYKRATVSISQDEYDRLREAERNLRAVPDLKQALFREISRQSQDAFQQDLNQFQQRQEMFKQAISGLDHTVQQLEMDTNQALQHLEANLHAETQSYAGCMWNYVDQVLNQHTAHFEEVIVANHRMYQEELYEVSRQTRRLEEDADRKFSMAKSWLNAAACLCSFIKENYDVAFFLPGQLEWLERQLVQAEQNLGIGLAEAVIVASQQLYTACSDMRIDLEMRVNEWNFIYQTTLETVNLLLGQIEESRLVAAVDLDGNILPVTIDVDFWTQGRLSQLATALNQIRERLEDPDQRMQTADLEQCLSHDLPGFDRALGEMVLDARVTALNSQLRINVADLVIHALQEQGFSLGEFDYESEDMRQSFFARLNNLEGNEVMVYVTPSGNEIGENELHLESFDREERTEHELLQRWLEINRSLAAYGLTVGRLQNPEPTGNSAARKRAAPAMHNQIKTTKWGRQASTGQAYGD